MPKAAAEIPAWIRITLKLAGVYNWVWGTWLIFMPHHPFQLLKIAAPNYPPLVQCLGMAIGVYGIGYWIAADDSVTHWPIVFVGLLGKVFGPIGFVYSAFSEQLPWSMGIGILSNDLIWWGPFVAILVHAARAHEPHGRATDAINVSPRHDIIRMS